MFKWLREYLELKSEFRVCHSCETLQMQLAIANQEKRQLLDSILEKPEAEPKPIDTSNLRPITSAHMPWRVRQAALENESRQAAKLLNEQKKNSAPHIAGSTISTDDLERELNVAEETRLNK